MAEKKVNDNEEFSFRWGVPVLDEGFVPVFHFMLRHYHEVGVSRPEFLLILHLGAYRFENPERGESRPSLKTIAEQMGTTRRYVRRLVASLQANGMLKVIRRPGKPSIYEFSGFAKATLRAAGLG